MTNITDSFLRIRRYLIFMNDVMDEIANVAAEFGFDYRGIVEPLYSGSDAIPDDVFERLERGHKLEFVVEHYPDGKVAFEIDSSPYDRRFSRHVGYPRDLDLGELRRFIASYMNEVSNKKITV